MAKLTLADAEKTAARTRPWTFRLEFHGTTSNGNTSDKFWFATGRGLNEAVEIGYGAIGNAPQYQLIDFTELRTRVTEKLKKGYDYADTVYIRMSAANFAKVMGGLPPTPQPPVPVTPPPVPSAPPPTPWPGSNPNKANPVPVPKGVPVYTKPPTPALLSLGVPYNLIRALKMLREGTTSNVTGWAALDECGNELLVLDPAAAAKFAADYDIEIEFS